MNRRDFFKGLLSAGILAPLVKYLPAEEPARPANDFADAGIGPGDICEDFTEPVKFVKRDDLADFLTILEPEESPTLTMYEKPMPTEAELKRIFDEIYRVP